MSTNGSIVSYEVRVHSVRLTRRRGLETLGSYSANFGQTVFAPI